MRKKNNIVQVVGIPGSGKSFLLKQYAQSYKEEMEIIEYGNELTKLINEKLNLSIEKDYIKYINSTILEECCSSLIDEILQMQVKKLIILISHMVFKDRDKYTVYCDSEIKLNCKGYVHVSSDPQEIFFRRVNNKEDKRMRELEDILSISDHQNESIKITKRVAEQLGSNYIEIQNNIDNVDLNVELLNKFFKEFYKST